MPTALFLCLMLLMPVAQAESSMSSETSQNTHSFWLTSGFISYHFQTDQNLRNDNAGVGAEYHYADDRWVSLGRYNNSNWQVTRYLAWQVYPLQWKAAKFGVALGLFDGYPQANNGGWFPAAIPAINFEYDRIGINIAAVPTIHDKLHAAVSVQAKLRLF